MRKALKKANGGNEERAEKKSSFNVHGVEMGRNVAINVTSNGGCRREEKSRKRCSLLIKLLSTVTATFFIC